MIGFGFWWVADGPYRDTGRLRLSVVWSYEQLSEPQQRMVREVSVFVGGWTLTAAAAVCTASDGEMQVLAELDRLVDLSLVNVEWKVGQEPRYRMLETVRQYAEAKLIEKGEREGARERHLDADLRLVDETTRIAMENRGEWEADIKCFDHDRENVLAAHEWCDQAIDGPKKGIRLANGMRWYWFSKDAFASDAGDLSRPISVGIRMLSTALSRPGVDPQSLDVARAHLNLANMLGEIGSHDLAKPHLDQGLVLAENIGRPVLIASAHYFLADHFRAIHDFPCAVRHLEVGRNVYQSEGKTRLLISAELDLGLLRCFMGDHDAAEAQIRSGLALARTKGAPADTVLGHLHLSV